MKSTKATAVIEVLVVLAVLGMATWLIKPKALDGDSRRAKQNIEATTKADEALQKQGATAAAKVTTVKEVVEGMPPTRETEFSSKELGSALDNLPKPDPDERFKSLERKLAVLSGDVKRTNELYEQDRKENRKLQSERDAAIKERDEAQQKIAQVAAERLGAERQRNAALVGIVLLAVAVGYLKFFGINRTTLGRMAADIRAGTDPIQAFDTHLAPWMHAGVNRASRLHTPHEEK